MAELPTAERRTAGVLAVAVAVAAVTGAIELFRPWVPVLALGVLYLFAVLPIAVVWGRLFAIGTSIASMLALNWFFLPPVHTFTLDDRENWYALAVYLAVGVVVADLAARARARAREAEQRERESASLADLSARFLSGVTVTDSLEEVAERVREILGLERARIELGPGHEPPRGESPLELRAGERLVGMLYAREGSGPNLAARRRFLPALASVLAVALDRERFAGEAVQAEALRRSDSIKTAVLRTVSHDLRTPLTAMRVAADALGDGSLELSEAERAELVESTRAELFRLERVVADLLDLSRLQAGATSPQRELWYVDDLVGRALDALGLDADRVTVAVGRDVPPVLVDPAHLERVLVNLIENGPQVHAPGLVGSGRRTLDAKGRAAPGRRPRPGHRRRGARVDLRTFRAERGRPRAHGARARHRARLRRGERRADLRRVSARPGRDLHGVPARRRGSRGDRGVSGARVLVVDDEPQIRRALQMTLGAAGYDVDVAGTGEEALTRAAVHPPDAVVLDLMLPGMNGIEVCRSLREWTRAPILILSAIGDEAEKVRALDAGADDYVTKPFGVDELLARLRASLRRSGPPGEPVLEVGRIRVDLDKQAAFRDGRRLQLTPHEFRMLRLFVQNEGKLLTHRTILRDVWGPAYQTESHYLHVYVSQLRRKIEDEPTRPRYLLTEPGAGYRFVAPDAA